MEINRFNKLSICLPSAFVNKPEYTDRNVKILDTGVHMLNLGLGRGPTEFHSWPSSRPVFSVADRKMEGRHQSTLIMCQVSLQILSNVTKGLIVSGERERGTRSVTGKGLFASFLVYF